MLGASVEARLVPVHATSARITVTWGLTIADVILAPFEATLPIVRQAELKSDEPESKKSAAVEVEP